MYPRKYSPKAPNPVITAPDPGNTGPNPGNNTPKLGVGGGLKTLADMSAKTVIFWDGSLALCLQMSDKLSKTLL